MESPGPFGTLGTAAEFLFSRLTGSDINDAWGAAANELGLSLKPKSFGSRPQLTGFVNGHDVSVDIDKKHRGKHNTVRTRFRIGMPSQGLDLKLKSKGFFDKINTALGAQDIVTGDTIFDDRILVKGHNEAAVRDHLTPERRRAVAGFLTSFKGARITDDEIAFSTSGYVRKPEELLGTINAMIDVAQVLTRKTNNDAQFDAPKPHAPKPDASETHPPESHAAEPHAPEPDGVEPEPSAREASRPDAREPVAPGPDAATPEVPMPETLTGTGPAIADFCAAVFPPGSLSFTATQKFKETYDGQQVVWTGTLESATPFTFDFDFGSKGGIKAELSILKNESGASRDVRAVIGLPTGTEGLEQMIGQSLRFSGTLLKVDGLARRVLISDAELLS